MSSPPFPPMDLRALVGPLDDELFDNPTGRPVFGEHVPVEAYRTVLDFGCGCGRNARRMMQQHTPPDEYVGLDLHAGMISWCQRNLSAVGPNFRFSHHDVHNVGLNPTGEAQQLALPVDNGWATLFVGWSVFTHLRQSQAEHYLGELARVLHPDGLAVTTWFLFEKRFYPMLQTFQNALYVNDVDPTNAVIFDREWLSGMLQATGLKVVHAAPPKIRGFQWTLTIAHAANARGEVLLPEDHAPFGVQAPPLIPANVGELGFKDASGDRGSA